MARDSHTRRRILYGSGVGMAAALAGCTGDGGDGDGDGDGGDGGDGDGNGTATPTPADGGDGDGDGDGDGGTETPTDTPDPAELPAVHMLTDYYGEIWEPRWNSLVESFGGETGIGVNIEESGMSGQQESRLAQLIQAGTPPDINTSTFDQVADIWAGGDLVPATDVVNSITETAGELQTEPLRDENDDLFQIPHGMYVSTFHYRTDIYNELGLEEPTSFQDVLDNAEAIDNSSFDARGYGLAGQRTGKSQDEFQVYLANMGVSGIGLRWVDPDARDELEIHFPEDTVVTLLEWFDDISQYSPDPTSIGWTTSIRNYIGGQFAQQYHLNIWAFGAAAGAGVAPIANNTQVAPLPRWEEGGITQDDVWLYEPAPDGYHIFADGDNTPGAKRWMEWLYASDMERTASMYAQEPSRFLPTYADVLESDGFQNMSFWQEWPDLLEQLEYVQNTILADYYGNVPESNLSSPIALYCQRQWFYGEMVNQVVTDSMTPQEAYEWGLGRLETHVADAREQFG